MAALSETNSQNSTKKKFTWVWDILLILVLVIAAYFRTVGIQWDDNHHLHPDERFLTMVETSIEPVKSLSEYFDTASSTLNPNNRGYSFYVYGTLPIFIVRYVAGWLGQSGYDQVNVVGRVISGIFDLGTIVMIYLIGKRLYRNSKLGLLAALFLALSVLPIQLSHYFAVDTFTNFFVYSALLAAICIADPSTSRVRTVDENSTEKTREKNWWLLNWREFIPYSLFGLLYGMALASKVSVYLLALALPIAALISYYRLPEEERQNRLPFLLRHLVIAGIIAFITFRFFQPYSFLGPGFFGLQINQNWLNSLREIRNISSGNVDVPYALQWARRPITFSWLNMVKWGLGIPLGVIAWAGFVWMVWRSFKGDWKRHVLILFWVGLVFFLQSVAHVKAMRYQLPIYPGLALMAAWFIFKLWEIKPKRVPKITRTNINWAKIFTVTLLVITVASSVLWAFAFTRIYTRPVTRVAASEWIYGHIPAAINLQFDPEAGMQFMQPVAYQNAAYISDEKPYIYGYSPLTDEKITSFTIEHVLSQQAVTTPVTFVVYIREPEENGATYKGAGFYQSLFDTSSNDQGEKVEIAFEKGVYLKQGKYYEIVLEAAEPNVLLRINGGLWLDVQSATGARVQYLSQPVNRLMKNAPFETTFLAQTAGSISAIQFGHIVDILNLPIEKTLSVSIIDPANNNAEIGHGYLADQFLMGDDPRGYSKWVELENPAVLEKGKAYLLRLTFGNTAGALGLFNDSLVMESSWDDAIPLGMMGYGPFGYETGLYGNNRNLEIYWNDNQEKLERFYSILDQSDVIVITSNRQWGTTVRVPERYPLTVEYYRALLGCPVSEDILKCYATAQPEMYSGQLGYELSAVFESNPNIGSFEINDQLAEEAFTVYDHPKVLIFRKTEQYTQQRVRDVLGSVDFGGVVQLTPAQASKYKGNLLLTEDEAKIQIDGGTWSLLFPSNSLLNQHPWLAVICWYLLVALLGLVNYPLVRKVFNGLPDKGYPFVKITGIVLLAYFTWIAASVGGQFSQLTILLVILAFLLVNGFLVYRNLEEIRQELRSRWKYFLAVEFISLLLFGLMLFIRWGNPDLWHPWRGGEKPMDLSYFTAVLKSTIFPPYDPWYSGGYINYYYFGFVLAAVPTKLLGIVPYIAYNLIIPTFFALTGLGVFSIGWNLIRHSLHLEDPLVEQIKLADRKSFTAGLLGIFFTVIAGNLGTVRLIWQAFQKLAAPDGVIDGARTVEHISWFFKGLSVYAKGGVELPIGFGDWFWVPSRALPGDTITEFPFFTFTYADLHAHMIALPITLIAISLTLTFLFTQWKKIDLSRLKNLGNLAITLSFAGLVLGVLKATNTWDWPTFTALLCSGILYVVVRYIEIPKWLLPNQQNWVRKIVTVGMIIVFIMAVSSLLFLPFSTNYAQAYGSIEKWTGEHSPLGSYLIHWGLPLFLIISWFTVETHQWLASTPAASIKKIQPYITYLQVLVILFFAILILLTALGIKIGWLVGILAAWDLILLLRSGISDEKRFVHFLIGTALVLTLFVEMFVLVGDVGRMNTVFKFYYQAWTMLTISATASLFWISQSSKASWKERSTYIWQIVLAILLIGVYLYPVTATTDKLRDRMSKLTPKTLDGLEFMKTSKYWDMDREMDLGQDYRAIRWMQDNVIGSPVIVETNTVEYKWGNRYTIYTGLPGVLGWNWHQRQQRGALDYFGIQDRLLEIPAFYLTDNIAQAREFLEKYDVEYIILGQQERAYYPGVGLIKFEEFDGIYWQEVYQELDTVIYRVNR